MFSQKHFNGYHFLPELRKDYFTGRLVIVSSDRSNSSMSRTLSKQENVTRETCPFCPGNEALTPPADLVLVQKYGSLVKESDSESEPVNDWSVRVFPNKFPAVTTKVDSNYSDSPLYSEPAVGYHYIVVATPNHDETFANLDVDSWVNALSVIQDKVRWLYAQKSVSYVVIYLNYGGRAGSTQPHPHLNIITLPRLPPLVEEEAITAQKSMMDLGICPMCSVVDVESGGPRQILASDFFIAFTPWASTHSYEFWVFPKKHQTSFLKTTQKEISDLSTILRATLGGLSKTLNDPPVNLVFHISSEKKTTKQIHWHMEIYPQLTTWAGLEQGTGVYINEVSPERAAGILGTAAKRELAMLIGVA